MPAPVRRCRGPPRRSSATRSPRAWWPAVSSITASASISRRGPAVERQGSAGGDARLLARPHAAGGVRADALDTRFLLVSRQAPHPCRSRARGRAAPAAPRSPSGPSSAAPRCGEGAAACARAAVPRRPQCSAQKDCRARPDLNERRAGHQLVAEHADAAPALQRPRPVEQGHRGRGGAGAGIEHLRRPG